MAPALLYLVRHAHTVANAHDTARLAGWSDFAVTSVGEGELRALGRLAAMSDAGPIIYSSTSQRAGRTAEVLATTTRSITPLRSLREINCGEVDGWRVSEVMTRHEQLWTKNAAQDDPDFRWPGGESYREFRARVLRALAAIAARHEGQRLFVVTHAGVISQLAGYIRGTSPAQWELWRPGNCSVTTVEWSEEGPRLLGFDSREHLASISDEGTHRRAG